MLNPDPEVKRPVGRSEVAMYKLAMLSSVVPVYLWPVNVLERYWLLLQSMTSEVNRKWPIINKTKECGYWDNQNSPSKQPRDSGLRESD